ncbi:spermidine/putrescine ABC transporter substrate-binding protein [Candidatus Sumerlaeota bacterium]|nr:spermidine/putrescine ABC transporter substrate-binding protein [Candidatus Sumerlaeota bacterium]MBI3736878.1 spermidine/putrescine ABC transporter substrate-binding protein [Candidatus Sumerlaeota bacterium]
MASVASCSKANSPEREGAARAPKRANQINVYMFSEYIDPGLPGEFERRTGIKVRIDVYEATEEMMAKLQNAGGAGLYDVLVVSDHAVPTLAKLGIIQPLNPSKIPNMKNVSPRFLNPPFDPGNKYSLPYQWGTMGIMYRKDKMPPLQSGGASWGLFFDAAKQPGPFLLIDSMRDMMSAALKYQGHSINSRDGAQLNSAADAILAAKKSAKCLGFEGGVGGKNRIVAGDATLAIVYNGDAVRAMDEDPNTDFVIPAEGTLIWVDTMTIPAKAPNPDGAHKFIDFILDPEVGAKLSNFNRYATPNAGSLPHIKPEDQKNTAIYPSEELMAKMEYLEDVGQDTRLYDEAWTAVKSR